jgi:hypothetical protein
LRMRGADLSHCRSSLTLCSMLGRKSASTNETGKRKDYLPCRHSAKFHLDNLAILWKLPLEALSDHIIGKES